jgi:hypothetical protein
MGARSLSEARVKPSTPAARCLCAHGRRSHRDPEHRRLQEVRTHHDRLHAHRSETTKTGFKSDIRRVSLSGNDFGAAAIDGVSEHTPIAAAGVDQVVWLGEEDSTAEEQ